MKRTDVHNKPVSDALLDRIVRVIVKEVEPEAVIVFGSQAAAMRVRLRMLTLSSWRQIPSGQGAAGSRKQQGFTRRWRGFTFPRISWSTLWKTSTTGGIPSTICSRAHCGRGKLSMSDFKCAGMLLKAAERDIDALRVLIRSDEISNEIIGFHVRQTTGKLLKAWIALEGVVYPSAHNIEG